uniref:Pentatricopeptide repeat-containing protein n=1 Tax=Trifolium pratense TaxID=57577 RepID=A0A2K3P474_TRIPR
MVSMAWMSGINGDGTGTKWAFLIAASRVFSNYRHQADMLSEEDFSSDVLTYNIVMLAKYSLGKMNLFHRLLYVMERSGLSPDFHTYNILLHVLGRGDKPLASVDLLNHMRERDVVAYTVMITGYVVACEFEKSQEMFDEMISRGQIPNVFTYNSMIRGFCMVGKFDEACSKLTEMETKDVGPKIESNVESVVGHLYCCQFFMQYSLHQHALWNLDAIVQIS